MGLPESGQVAIHAVFAGHFSALWEVIYFLVPGQALINLHLDVGRGPADGPFMIPLSCFTETVVFKRVAEQRNRDIIVKFEIEALVGWQVRPDRHGVDVGTEDQQVNEQVQPNDR